MKNNLKKDLFWNSLGTTFNSFNSLFFMIIVTRINGVNDAGIFTLGFSIACLFYIIGSYSGRAYQVTDNNKNNNDSNYFYTKVITCIFMLLIGLLYCFVKRYSFYKFSVIYFLIIYKFLEAFCEYIYAVLQKNNKLFIVGKSLFYKSILSLILFFIIDIFTKNLIATEIGIILINIIFINVYDFKKLKDVGFKLNKIEKNYVFNILKNGFFAFAFLFLTLYVINASKYSLDGIVSNKLQTIYGIIFMPATIMALLAQFIVQPFVLKLKTILPKSIIEFNKLNIKLCFCLIIFGIFIILLAYLFGIQFLQLFYGVNLINYRLHLIVVLFGAIIYSLTIVLSTSLTTMRNTKNQMAVFLITSILTMIISKKLILKYSLMGAALNYLLSMFFLLCLYLVIYIHSIYLFKKEVKNV